MNLTWPLRLLLIIGILFLSFMFSLFSFGFLPRITSFIMPSVIVGFYEILSLFLLRKIKDNSIDYIKIKILWIIFIFSFLSLWTMFYNFSQGFFPLILFTVPMYFILFYLIFTTSQLNKIKVGSTFFNNIFINNEDKKNSKEKNNYIWLILGFIIFSLSIIFLESRHSFFFTRDDNYSQFLPPILVGCKSFFSNHIFPTLNPYQFMGSPISNAGIYALTYPFTYLAYALARYVFHNEFLTFEVFCIFHLTIAYFTAYWAGRMAGLKSILSIIYSLCYCLSGFSLIVGSCWYHMTPIIALSPLFIVSLIYLQKNKPDFKWVIANGVLIGLLFHAGHIQMWVYLLMFTVIAIAIMLWTGQIKIKKALWIIPIFLLGLAIAAPLLVPEFLLVTGIKRHGVFDWGANILYNNFFNVFFPLSPPYRQVHYSGGMPTILAFSAIIILGFLIITKPSIEFFKNFVKTNIWLVLGFVAMVLALGPKAGLWSLLHSLPVLNGFRVPFKFLVFINLFFNLGGLLILQRFAAGQRKAKFIEAGALLIGLFLLIKYLFLPFYPLYYYADPVYPDKLFITYIIGNDQSSRIFPLTKGRDSQQDYVSSLMDNFSSIYSVLSTEGYDDSFESTVKENLLAYQKISKYKIKALKAYGVKYILYNPSATQSNNSPTFRNIKTQDLTNEIIKGSKLIANTHNTQFYTIDNPDNLAFVKNNPKKALPITFNGQGATVNSSEIKKPATIIVNMLWRPEFIVKADNKIIKGIPDEWGRFLIKVPANTRNIVLKYQPNWNLGFLAGLCLILLSILSGYFINKIDKTPKESQV